MSKKVIFTADKIAVTERMSDNSYKVQAWTGEYSQKEMSQLMLLDKNKTLKITVEEDG